MTIAKTILQQLGGNRMIAMTGAHTLVDHGNALSVKFKGSKAANYAKITLNSMDTYDIEFIKIAPMTPANAMKWVGMSEEELDAKMNKNKKEFSNIYNDQLIAIFEEHTGLYLTF